ncbi:hypothetical protein EDEG_03672 [Edhazardia aedis USNM 41457]|uniref:Uncharacterized protein n=1 Tax=Edhazardia aedis (strain USNM 41457) TaxID=1003232 RepID=J8ZQ72_EDHAE|nr:hypothetical protein EDEG_03672 [Edhazardia aedis USNM 41457]|eukprot:EJW01843.1 hypothetical protein EDEG_03672 [Edhazardia aedis USNM 41457]
MLFCCTLYSNGEYICCHNICNQLLLCTENFVYVFCNYILTDSLKIEATSAIKSDGYKTFIGTLKGQLFHCQIIDGCLYILETLNLLGRILCISLYKENLYVFDGYGILYVFNIENKLTLIDVRILNILITNADFSNDLFICSDSEGYICFINMNLDFIEIIRSENHIQSTDKSKHIHKQNLFRTTLCKNKFLFCRQKENLGNLSNSDAKFANRHDETDRHMSFETKNNNFKANNDINNIIHKLSELFPTNFKTYKISQNLNKHKIHSSVITKMIFLKSKLKTEIYTCSDDHTLRKIEISPYKNNISCLSQNLKNQKDSYFSLFENSEYDAKKHTNNIFPTQIPIEDKIKVPPKSVNIFPLIENNLQINKVSNTENINNITFMKYYKSFENKIYPSKQNSFDHIHQMLQFNDQKFESINNLAMNLVDCSDISITCNSDENFVDKADLSTEKNNRHLFKLNIYKPILFSNAVITDFIIINNYIFTVSKDRILSKYDLKKMELINQFKVKVYRPNSILNVKGTNEIIILGNGVEVVGI